jgi:predicted Zn-ribbon and HTH transcriptional regulator
MVKLIRHRDEDEPEDYVQHAIKKRVRKTRTLVLEHWVCPQSGCAGEMIATHADILSVIAGDGDSVMYLHECRTCGYEAKDPESFPIVLEEYGDD